MPVIVGLFANASLTIPRQTDVMVRALPLFAPAMLGALMAAGCSTQSINQADLDSLDRELTASLDQTIVDPTAAAFAGRQRGGAPCTSKITYSEGWAGRLPAELPLYPDARITDAAGVDQDGCHLRIVSFISRADMNRVTDWYRARAVAAGYSAEQKAGSAQNVLAGTRSDAAYMVYVAPRRTGGVDVDLVSNARR